MGIRVRFTQSTRIHHIGRGSARFVMNTYDPTPTVTTRGEDALEWLGEDERGRELHIIAVPLADETLLVIHVFPTALLRKDKP